MASEEGVVLVDPRQNMVVGWGVYALGAVQVMGGAWVLLASEEESLAARLFLTVLLGVSGLLFLLVGRLIGEPKGGMVWEPGSRRFRLAGASDEDTLDIPADAVRGVMVASRTERWGREETEVEIGAVELLLRSGATVLVAEPGDEERAGDVAAGLREVTGLPAVDAPTRVTPRRPEAEVRVGAGFPLGRPLVAAGVLSLGVGGVMVANVANAPVFGFLFGPTLSAIGLCFLGLVGGKALATESLRVGVGVWRHAVHLGGRQVFLRELAGEDDHGRIRVASRGGQGFCLHLVRGGSVEVALNGVSRRTRFSPMDLLTLAGELAGSPSEPAAGGAGEESV
jgi:hypothetical protein